MLNFIKGILISGSMIMAIGAQNTHVIRYGLSRINIFFVSLTCFLCDVFLMSMGVFFIGSVSDLNNYFKIVICILSILFLLFYAYCSFVSALKNKNMDEISFDYSIKKETVRKSILSTLAVTLLNPHVYLDTVVIVGGFASSLTLYNKILFISGALLTSGIWFFSLGYLSKYLSKYFKNKKTWVIFDLSVSVFMLFLAFSLSHYLIFELI